LKWYDGGGENGITSKSVFLLSKYWLPILFEETLGAFFSLFFMLHLLRTWGFDDIWGENHVLRLLFKWLQYTDGGHIFWNGVVDILVVDAYFRVEVCTSIFLGEASN
jgi:hypothetical protein